jgi:acyl-CoA thioester hydrolase
MPAVFHHPIVVSPSALDINGHVNNVEFVRWLQEAAVAHSDAQGWTRAAYERIKATWVVRSHLVEYLRPAFAGDHLEVVTWVGDFRRIRSRRHYRVRRAADGALLVRAETDWVFVDLTTGKPRPAPAEVVTAFRLVTQDPLADRSPH